MHHQRRREAAGACPKPTAPIASNRQPGNDADECHNNEDLPEGVSEKTRDEVIDAVAEETEAGE